MCNPAPLKAELPLKVQLVTVELRPYIPPPNLAELPLKVQLVTVGEDEKLHIPPPIPLFILAELSLKVQLVTVGEDWLLNIPPPYLCWPEDALAFPTVTVNPSNTAALVKLLE